MISIIIPNYNHAKYLDQRINSVLDQTYQDIEVIILDDCSKDNSRDIIDKYRDHPKVSNVVFNEVNSGSTFKQWDKGIALAKGNYIWIAESDDYADKKFLESIYDIIKNNPEIGLAYCGSNTVDEDGEIIGELVREVKTNKDGYYLNKGYDEARDAFFFHPIVPNASAVVFKKQNFYQVNDQFKQYKICGDWQFWTDVSYPGSIAYLPQKLNYFRQSNTSVSRSNLYVKDNYRVFLLEKLRIGVYIYKKTGCKIPLSHRLKYINNYLFEVLLEASRKRIFVSWKEWTVIFKSLSVLSFLTPFIFFGSFARVVLFAIRKVKRKISK